MSKPIIVGVDIGITTGLAIYDLNRNLLFTGSKRNISIERLIREISFYGRPLIISTDKRKIPQPVSKIAASFNCKVFNPDHDLTVEEKDEIVRIPIKDIHEKDALSAATYAFKHFASQFNIIERNLESLGLIQLQDRVKEMIVRKEAKNISEAIEKLKPKEEEKIEKVSKEIYLNWREKAKELENKFKEEMRRNEILKNYVEKLEEKARDLERQKQMYIDEEIKKNDEARKSVIKDKEIKTRDILIKQLQFELLKQKNLRKTFQENLDVQEELRNIDIEKLIPVVIIPEFTRESISYANRKFDIRNKVVWIKNFVSSKISANFMAYLNPKVVIGEVDEETKDIFRKKGIIVVSTLKPEIRNYYAAVSPESIENEIKKIERKDFLNWLEGYRRRAI